MENMLDVFEYFDPFAVFFLFMLGLGVNFTCDYILSKLNKDEPLSNWTILPPFGIIALIIYPFRKSHHKDDQRKSWATEKLEMTDDEYDFMINNIKDKELEQLFTPAKTWKDKKKILQIRNKYIKLYHEDFFKRSGQWFNS